MTIRTTYLISFALITALLSASLYFQFVEGFIPCPLCTLQRFSFGVLGILFLVGGLAYGKRPIRIIVNTLCMLVSIVGIGLAGRQVWLQAFPSPDNTECGVSIQYMMQVLPLHEVAQKIFAGSAECTQRGWEFLHLNMAEWTLIWFVGFLLITLCVFAEEFKWTKKK